MAPALKKYCCVICGEEDRLNFYKNNYRSLCKKHFSVKKTPSLKKKMLRPYLCVFCGDSNVNNFHVYCKNKCKEHYNCKR